MNRICIIPRVSGVGGMVSFRGRFSAGLAARGIQVTHDLGDTPYDSVLVIGGTRDLPGLWRARRRGVRIVQRLNGMNWLHRHRNTGLKHYLRAEYGNRVLRIIRSRLVDHIVYQSRFARDWWERVVGPAPVPASVVYNAVDLELHSPGAAAPEPDSDLPDDRYRVLLVEGSLMGGYELGLETAVGLVERLNDAHSHNLDRPVELLVAGRVSEAIKKQWSGRTAVPLVWTGLVAPERIPVLDRSAHLLYSADINPACPNAVIEALACGLPVLAFDTGALPELVTDGAGRVVPYGGDPWKLDPPDIQALADGAVEIFTRQDSFRPAARARAEAVFGLEGMVDGYLDALTPR